MAEWLMFAAASLNENAVLYCSSGVRCVNANCVEGKCAYVGQYEQEWECTGQTSTPHLF